MMLYPELNEGTTHFTTNFPIDGEYYVDGDPANHAAKNVLDDDFDEVIKTRLSRPESESVVEAAVTEGRAIDVILWRGTSGVCVRDMEVHKCASGTVCSPDVGRPTDAQAREQVGKGGKLPEFTTSNGLSGYSFLHWLVVVRINTKYLARGSGSENGWVCLPEAPIDVLQTVDRTLGFLEEPGWNAS